VDAHDRMAARPTRDTEAERGQCGRTVVFVVRGPIAEADIAGLCARVRGLLDARDVDRVVCDVADLTAADGITIDALARLQLAARRRGCRVVLRGASIDLLGLLSAAGLSEVVPLAD
jgi:ABC-type transporter Mla MlaB component